MASGLWRDLLEQWGFTGLRVNAGVLSAEFGPRDADRQAAWELYVELLTRIATQPLPADDGDEATALESVYSLFATTREILRRHGSSCIEFAKLAIIVLNQVVRPFTAKWHKESLDAAFDDPAKCAAFRAELAALQRTLQAYMKALADIAMVEDLSDLEIESSDTAERRR